MRKTIYVKRISDWEEICRRAKESGRSVSEFISVCALGSVDKPKVSQAQLDRIEGKIDKSYEIFSAILKQHRLDYESYKGLEKTATEDALKSLSYSDLKTESNALKNQDGGELLPGDKNENDKIKSQIKAEAQAKLDAERKARSIKAEKIEQVRSEIPFNPQIKDKDKKGG